MNQENLDKLEKRLEKEKIEGFIIQRENQTIFEYVKNKKIKEKPSKVYSITKSIVGLLIGILLDKGLIKDVYEPIYQYFPELLKTNDHYKKEITIFHLLTMTSGLKVTAFQGTKNWISSILEQPMLYEPGTTFQYNSGDSHLLSAIISKVSGKSTATFADENFFGSLGINKYIWVKDPQGIHGGGFSISLNLEDMMKIGRLLLEEGKYNSKQIISSTWVKDAQSTNQIVEDAENGLYGYGYQLWTFEGNQTQHNIDYYCANGLFGQYVFVVPKQDMVAVVKSKLQDENQSLPRIYFEEFLRELSI